MSRPPFRSGPCAHNAGAGGRPIAGARPDQPPIHTRGSGSASPSCRNRTSCTARAPSAEGGGEGANGLKGLRRQRQQTRMKQPSSNEPSARCRANSERSPNPQRTEPTAPSAHSLHSARAAVRRAPTAAAGEGTGVRRALRVARERTCSDQPSAPHGISPRRANHGRTRPNTWR